MYVAMYVKQKQLGCKKSARPIRSSIVHSYSYKQPKSLIYKLFYNYDCLCHLATFFIKVVK